jgi:hypothetical protein
MSNAEAVKVEWLRVIRLLAAFSAGNYDRSTRIGSQLNGLRFGLDLLNQRKAELEKGH